jgi:hypothetical protein
LGFFVDMNAMSANQLIAPDSRLPACPKSANSGHQSSYTLFLQISALRSRGRKSAVLDGLQCEDVIARGGSNRCAEKPYLNSGGDIYDLNKRVGHSSLKQTEEYLAHVTSTQARIAK